MNETRAGTTRCQKINFKKSSWISLRLCLGAFAFDVDKLSVWRRESVFREVLRCFAAVVSEVPAKQRFFMS